MKKFFLFIMLAFFTSFVAYSQLPDFVFFESGPAGQNAKPLRSHADPQLTQGLVDHLTKNRHWKKLIAEKKMSISLVDLKDPQHPRFASVNGNEMMYAASLPKIAVLLAAMEAIENEELKATPEVKRDMRIMISKSSNQAATRMIDRVGYEKIAKVLTHPKYRLYDENQGGGLWVGKKYARSGKRNPDPMKGLSHAATSDQVARFYYLMANGLLVSPEKSSEMLEIMEGPELHHKFVNTLNRLAPKATVFRKSGSWGTYHSDSALVQDEGWRNYILVALIDDPNGEVICRELVGVAENLLRSTPSLQAGGR